MGLKRILTPGNFFVYAVLEIAAHFIIPVAIVVSGTWRWSGAVLVLIGAWLVFSSNRLFKRLGTTVKSKELPSVLVREGPFKLSRNPMYLGMLLALIGEAILLGSLSPFLAPLAFFLTVNTIYVAVEEQTLSETFGDEFAAYKQQVRKWI